MSDPMIIYAKPLMAWEMRLYLNTHPTDRRAIRIFERMIRASGCENYARICDCQDASDSALDAIDSAACREGTDECDLCCDENESACPLSWSWVEDPWPWEAAAC